MADTVRRTLGMRFSGWRCDGTGEEVVCAASALAAGVDGFADAEKSASISSYDRKVVGPYHVDQR